MPIRSQVLTLITILFLALPLRAFATTYGNGTYGSGVYGGVVTSTPTTGTSNTSSQTAGPPDAGCAQAPPGSAPWLYGAVAQDAHSVLLYFTDSADPVDHYVLQYGNKNGEYPWGASDIGKKGVRTYLVQSLAPNTIYHFRVSGANGCANGTWSNDLSATTLRTFLQTGFRPQLAIKSIDLTPEPPIPTRTPSKQLETQSASSSAILPPLTQETLEYELTVHVVDTNHTPIPGAMVTIDPESRTHTSDEHGGVTYRQLRSGDHTVFISYQGKDAQSHIFLSGTEKSRELTVTIETIQATQTLKQFPRVLIGAVTLIALLLIIGLIFFFRRK